MITLKNFLICLTGLPASGKSTFSKILKQKLSAFFKEYEINIIDPDLIRKSLTNNEFDSTKEKIVKDKNLEKIYKALKKGEIVISDDLNYFTSMRHDLKNIAEFFNLPFFIVHIATSLETCLNWNKKRGGKIPDHLINKIHTRFDYFDKYQWDRPFYEFDPSKPNDIEKHATEFVSKILSSISEPSMNDKNEFEQETNSNILIERLERITRRTVGNLIKNSKNDPLKEKILELRKIFVKRNINSSLSEPEIEKNLILFLEETLNTKLS